MIKIIENQAQISDDTDESGKPVTDRDSTPNVWVEGEDKIEIDLTDIAKQADMSKIERYDYAFDPDGEEWAARLLRRVRASAATVPKERAQMEGDFFQARARKTYGSAEKGTGIIEMPF